MLILSAFHTQNWRSLKVANGPAGAEVVFSLKLAEIIAESSF